MLGYILCTLYCGHILIIVCLSRLILEEKGSSHIIYYKLARVSIESYAIS
jgi:hypothetical protein